MPTAPRPRRPLAVLLTLALTVVVTSAGVAVARQQDPPVVRQAPVGTGAVAATRATPVHSSGPMPDLASAASLRREHRMVTAPAPVAAKTSWVSRSTAPAPVAKARTVAKSSTSGSAAGLSGRNKVWMPALGIRKSISFFSCSSNAYPGNRVYRWGCAGHNNVYLFGHAYSVFKPLHDAYVRGRLKKGMKLYYADSRGKVSTYKVIWWRVTRPDKGGFAYAGQSRPSLTLQTCVGARSQFRLIVRLVRV